MTAPYFSSLKECARELRKRQTPAEARFWQIVRAKRFFGYKFIRQQPVDEYIADFYCHELQLVIEIDGDIHLKQKEVDAIRSNNLKYYQLTVIRYTNDQILYELPRVKQHLEKIIHFLKRHPSLHKRGAGGESC